MRSEINTWRPRARIVAGLAVIAALAPSAWGYINGGDFHNSLDREKKTLQAEGWGVSFGAGVSGDPRAARGLAFVPLDDPEHQQYVNQLVGQALQVLPKDEAAKISVEAKREIASLTREAIQKALADKRQVVKKGNTGSLEYQVGVFAFESYWETNYGGKREIHARRSGLAPFVALKLVTTKD